MSFTVHGQLWLHMSAEESVEFTKLVSAIDHSVHQVSFVSADAVHTAEPTDAQEEAFLKFCDPLLDHDLAAAKKPRLE